MIVDLFFIDCPLQRLPGFQPETPAKKINMGFAKVNVFFFREELPLQIKDEGIKINRQIYIYINMYIYIYYTQIMW